MLIKRYHKESEKDHQEDTCNLKLTWNRYAEFLENASTSLRKGKISKDTNMYELHRRRNTSSK